MDNDSKEIIDEFVNVLSEIIPPAKIAYGFLKILYKIGFKQNKKLDLIQQIAKEITQKIYDSTNLDEKNKGAAKASAYDIIDMIRRSKIDEKFLIENKLNKELIVSKILENGNDITSTASMIRNSIIVYGLNLFVEKLIEHSMELPKMKLELTKFILSNFKN